MSSRPLRVLLLLLASCAGGDRYIAPGGAAPLDPEHPPDLDHVPENMSAIGIFIAPEVQFSGDADGKAWADEFPTAIRSALSRAGFQALTSGEHAEVVGRVRVEVRYYSGAGESANGLTLSMSLEYQSALVDELTFQSPDGGEPRKLRDLGAIVFSNALAKSPRMERIASAKSDAQAKAQGTVPRAVQKAVVAVFDVEDPAKRTDPSTLDQLTEYLAVQITAVSGLKVVPRDQLRSRLAGEKATSYKTCYDESCQIELGKAVSAQKTLSTKLLQIGKKCAITSTLYDLKSETTERAASVDTDCSVDALIGGVRQIAQQLGPTAQ
jgi:hypothetical protein